MASIGFLIVSALRALVEVALIALFAQGLLALLAGARRGANPIYRLFQIVTGPVLRGVRFITPKVFLDKHLPFVAFFFLFWLWIILAYAKRVICGVDGLACGR